MSETSKNTVPPPIVAIAAWILPGAGYWIIGQRRRAITVCVAILGLFIMGLFIGGLKVIEVPIGWSMKEIMDHPWFIGQILAGPIVMAAAQLGKDATVLPVYGRINEIGTLYTAVAGMLNLLVVIDASYRCTHEEEQG